MNKTLTYGELRVRTEFNPSALDSVSQIKQKSAELINITNNLIIEGAGENSTEKQRLINLATDAYELAAMWAVKAATFK